MLICIPQNFPEYFIKSRIYYVILFKRLCKLLECSRTLYEYIYRLTYVVVGVIVVVGATTVLKALPRESYWGELLISRNFGDSSEIVSVVI